MVTQVPHRGAVLLLLAFVLSCFAIGLAVWIELGGSVPLAASGYRFQASFQNASQLAPGADVRISGVSVGHVVAVAERGEETDATIEMNSPYAPIPDDTRAILRQKTLLGETFVALTPGSSSAPKLPDGGRLPSSDVLPTQPLDRILNAFDKPTRQAFGALLRGIATSVDQRGQALNAILGGADPALADMNTIVAMLDQQSGSVQSLIGDGGSVLRTLGSRGTDLQTLVRAGNAVFQATAARNAQLTATVDALPPFLAALRGTLGAADRSAAYAAPSLAALRPATPLVAPALSELTTLAPRGRALLGQFNSLLGLSQRALPAATKLVEGLPPLAAQLLPVARNVTPVIALLGLYDRELVATFANVGASTEGTSTASTGSLQHYLRVLVPINSEGLVGYSERLPTNRHNPYFAPGELARIGRGLESSDCRNTSNPSQAGSAGASAPPCRLQPLWLFGGVRRYYPHVTAGSG